MKALILAAGYATRLYPLTENQAKPLLKVGDKAIIEHLIGKINAIEEIKEIFVVTNDKFYHHFVEWKNNLALSKLLKPIKIINDGSKNNGNRLEAVGDINFVLQKENINDDILIVAGDNLFKFSLQDFVNKFRENDNYSLAAFHDLKDLKKIKGRFGAGIIKGLKVINFEEKPQYPQSTLASAACYIFHKNDLPLISLLAEKRKADNTGDLVKWLIEKSTVYGYIFTEKWFDIGTMDAWEEAKENYIHNEN